MADELLRALGRRQREVAEHDSHLGDAVEGDAGEALLDGLFDALDAGAEPKADLGEQKPTAASNVTELPRRSSWWGVAAVGLAAAAALVLWISSRGPNVSALPTYRAVVVAGGPSEVRGAKDDVATRVELSSPTDAIDWRFSAASTVEQDVAVGLLATSGAGDVVYSRAVAAEITDSGSVALRGPLDSFIALDPGDWTVEVLVAAADAVPDSADEAQASDWQRLPIEVMISSP